ncbi:MAG: septum site-determining protein MinC [Xylanivirga thermophila]|jgi:septum site-determining protein MinC|uniref:septum site-determining protein MinC n=1 Tax=Xylanivirga thermophila TaxID=2496273 RepID=UPI00101B9FAE|nr:septum site-determining protein MinC [Xylanivirga thermophila]
MKESSVLFKGMRGGIKVYIDDDAELSQIKSDLTSKIEENIHFFDGTAVNLFIMGKKLDPQEKGEILSLLAHDIDIGSIKFGDAVHSDQQNQAHLEKEVNAAMDADRTRFVKGTIRSGQRIFYQGNVVVVGDVNPGGEVIAEGNIVVFGNLRGLAHAGATGNKDAYVVSISLQPTQLRIATVITRPPEEDKAKSNCPEIAYIKDNILVIEPYSSIRIK